MGAVDCAIAVAGVAARGFGGGLCSADTVMVGRAVAVGDEFGGGSGLVAAGASPAGEGCVGGGGGVCAQAPTQTDEMRNDVDASKRGRNKLNTPVRRGDEL